MSALCVRKLLASVLIAASLASSGCVTYPQHPCQDGGEPPSDKKIKWTKQCDQKYDKTSDKWMNEGRYTEWYPNGKRAISGEYRAGKKHGKWTEWDENGKQLFEKYFYEGEEIPRFETPKKRIAGAPPPLTPEEQQLLDEKNREMKSRKN